MGILSDDAQKSFNGLSHDIHDIIQDFRVAHDLSERFDIGVQRAWLEGFADAYHLQIHNFLDLRFPRRDQLADFLKLTLPAISKNRKAKRLTPQHFWAVWLEFPDFIQELLADQIKEDEAKISGYLSAVQYAQQQLPRDRDSSVEPFSRDDFLLLKATLSSGAWARALVKKKSREIDVAARAIYGSIPPMRWPSDPAQRLKHLIAKWGISFLLAADSLME